MLMDRSRCDQLTQFAQSFVDLMHNLLVKIAYSMKLNFQLSIFRLKGFFLVSFLFNKILQISPNA